LAKTLHAHSNALLQLGQIYKQIDAPFGELAESTLTVSTYALKSNSSGDETYNNLENKIKSWTARRDALTAQIKPMIEEAEFNGQAINEQQGKQIISEGQTLLDQASVCASDPARCAR
ncbi:MAG TPA: hypothetical protein VE195_07355, partial [Acidobacteriaceae bacterium]|nr:hypothetical protein [Acidobacteriaceae bacterium]